MKLSAYHKSIGDEVCWYEDDTNRQYDKVYISKVFSFSSDYEGEINAREIVRGGSGYAIKLVDGIETYDKSVDHNLPYEIEHIYPDYSIYPEHTKDTAYGFLTRGCPRACGFCHVATKEGRRSVKVADISEFWRGQKNIMLCDPNILACREHLDLLHQLIDTKAKINFNGGLDIRLITDDNLELISQLKLKRIHFAFDRWQDKDIIEPKLRQFKERTGYGRGKIMVYILVNFDTTLDEDLYRVQLCRELNFQPYIMIYDKANCDRIYKRMQRWCSPFIFWKVDTFEEYLKTYKRG